MTPAKKRLGLLGPLRDRVRDLERELENEKRIASQEIHRLTTENARLQMALNAMTPPAVESPS